MNLDLLQVPWDIIIDVSVIVLAGLATGFKVKKEVYKKLLEEKEKQIDTIEMAKDQNEAENASLRELNSRQRLQIAQHEFSYKGDQERIKQLREEVDRLSALCLPDLKRNILEIAVEEVEGLRMKKALLFLDSIEEKNRKFNVEPNNNQKEV